MEKFKVKGILNIEFEMEVEAETAEGAQRIAEKSRQDCIDACVDERIDILHIY